MNINVLGVCGSPVKGGNTEALLNQALKAAGAIDGVSTEMLLLAGKQIADCRHCNWCLARQEEGKPCVIDDEMVDMFPKILEADILLLATPAYAARLSGYMAVFLDRFRGLVLGKHYKGSLGGKVGGALTVAWLRNAGQETTLLSVISSLLMWGMIVINPGPGTCQYGATGLSSDLGTGNFDPKDRLGVLKDEMGMKSAASLGERSVQIARVLKAGRAVLSTEY